MNLSDISPVILTWNEEPNIRRCLEGLTWAKRILVVDSGSTDDTGTICRQFPNAELVVRPFDDHTSQWNFGIDGAATDWILSLDADYVVNPEFVNELRALPSDTAEKAWFAPFRFLIFGKPLRGSIYPPRALLFDRRCARYRADGHTQLLKVIGPTGMMSTRIDHDDRKPLSRWFQSQIRYAVLEVEKLEAEESPSGLPDRIRKMILPAAPLTLFYTLLAKGALFDGRAGWFYALQRTFAELLLSLMLLERRLCPKKNGENNVS
ncbi:MAG: glycosyltransferase family 2 protein [Verrucomicrobiales bacterium]|nr:glycosyltransferase family 2 protein [Verrucomicrobiales bacterium]MBP9223617.1 glycosyltransferase family 2 protein [Verrucomicrobiales bacterium]